jgi:Rps23 Pro-64 3,4-dihydroxylase Tpa1-like proline 4-hydroxylase
VNTEEPPARDAHPAEAQGWSGREWFAFERDRLRSLADSLRAEYATAQPFPHVVIDGVLPDKVLDRVVDEFPATSDRWRHFDDDNQRKYGGGLTELDLGSTTRNVLAEFNSSAFVDFLQVLTGIEEPLIPDPHYRGGGLHHIEPGGYLEVHADFNRHPTFGLDRRVNVLVYLNKDWQSEWGGQLELWNRSVSRPERRIDPVFNRMVVFSITDIAFHGHPEILRSPEGHPRRSLAFYYYSNGRPVTERSDAHSTLFQGSRTSQGRREHADRDYAG